MADLFSSIPPCSEASRACGEPLLATAPEQTPHVLALPFEGAWPPREAIRHAPLPEPVRALADWAMARPDVRPQLVRAVGTAGRSPRAADRVLLARTAGRWGAALAAAPATALTPDACEAFLDAGRIVSPLEPVEAPLVLVCVHGRRDACCARHGVALATALAREAGVRVLGSSHLGGHRFAATALVLPHGEMFGRLAPADAPALAAFARGEGPAPADRYRGRIGRPAAVQAALAWWLERAGERLPDAAVAVEHEAGGRARLAVRPPAGGEVRLLVRRRPSALVRPLGCGEPSTPAQAVEVFEVAGGLGPNGRAPGGP